MCARVASLTTAVLLAFLGTFGAADSLAQKPGKDAPIADYPGLLRLLDQKKSSKEILQRLKESPIQWTVSEEQLATLRSKGATPELIAFLRSTAARAVPSDVRNIGLVLDCSGSMLDKLPEGRTKMDVAKQVVTDFIRSIRNGKKLTFVVYGLNPKKECEDVQVVTPLTEVTDKLKNDLVRFIAGLEPLGQTPLARAMEVAGRELEKGNPQLSMLIVITDGVDSCKGNPGTVADQLVTRLKLSFVDLIGLGMDPIEMKALEKLSRESLRVSPSKKTAELVARINQAEKDAGKPAKVPDPPKDGLKVVWRRPASDGRGGVVFTCFSDDGRRCAAASHIGGFRIWETETGELVQKRDYVSGIQNIRAYLHIRFLAESKEGLFFVRQVGTGPDVREIFRLELAKLKTLQEHRVIRGGFSTPPGPDALWWDAVGGIGPEGETLAGRNGTDVYVWDLKTGKKRFHVEPLEKKTAKTSSFLTSCPFSPDGKRVLMLDRLAAGEGHLRIFDAVTGKSLLSRAVKLSLDDQASPTWNADGRRIYLSAHEPESKAAVIACLDAESGDVVSRVPLTPDLRSTQGRCFNRDARWFAAQYPKEKRIDVYDARSGKLVGTAVGPNNAFTVSFSPDGRYLACGSGVEFLIYRLPDLPPSADKK